MVYVTHNFIKEFKWKFNTECHMLQTKVMQYRENSCSINQENSFYIPYKYSYYIMYETSKLISTNNG